jgi:hypothetical protein
MKTALDWLIEQMPYEFRAKYANDLFKQAKQLEKEQIIDAQVYVRVASDLVENDITKIVYKRWSEQYYEQTYNQKQHIIDIMKADEDDGLYNQNI